jgi:hypothetical protein
LDSRKDPLCLNLFTFELALLYFKRAANFEWQFEVSKK